MNWTKELPLEGVKYIVRTDLQRLFPAVYVDGVWMHSEFDFEIRNVCSWILYPDRQPDHESLNNDIPDGVLLRYLVRDYRTEQEKVKQLRQLNMELTREVSRQKGLNDHLAGRLKQIEAAMHRVCQILDNPKLWKKEDTTEPNEPEIVE